MTGRKMKNCYCLNITLENIVIVLHQHYFSLPVLRLNDQLCKKVQNAIHIKDYPPSMFLQNI